MGSVLLPAVSNQRKEPRRRAAVPGPTLAKDRLENVVDKNLLQRRFPHGQSTQTWVVDPHSKPQQIRVNNFYEKPLASTENFWAIVCNPFRILSYEDEGDNEDGLGGGGY